MIFLGVEAVEALHDEQIRRFGGSPGLRDRGLLESAVLRPEHRFRYDAAATIAELGAALGWGFIKITPSWTATSASVSSVWSSSWT